MTEWITYKGYNPPKRCGMNVTAQWKSGDLTTWGADRVPGLEYPWGTLAAYHLDDPYEPPLPRCPICNESADEWQSYAGTCECGCSAHGHGVGGSHSTARENWRKLRGEI